MTDGRNTDDMIDDGVDDEIYACLNLDKPVSFFLFAGAGSGKTRSLVKALSRIRDEYGRRLLLRGQRVGVITYTNAACDEIKQRLEFDPLIDVSTIHSFAWTLIGGFHDDIRGWLRVHLAHEIDELEEAQRKGRAGTKAASDRERSIESKKRRLASLESIRTFTYSPTGDNRSRDSLNHSEVISITSAFLVQKPALPLILINKYPILLIDESQDTNKHLLDALLFVQAKFQARFCLGLFGDVMQRIYADGKVGLAQSVPDSWAQPAKRMNHRSPERIVRLINRVRLSVDDHQQQARSDKPNGVVRMFILGTETPDKFAAEASIAKRMAQITGDALWEGDGAAVKTLTLEHHMAARRMGFLDIFAPLHAVDQFRTGLLDGSLSGIRLFTHDVLPLVRAGRSGDDFAVASVIRARSPLLKKATLKAAGPKQLEALKTARDATADLMSLWSVSAEPRLLDVLRSVAKSGLFEIPDALRIAASRNTASDPQTNATPTAIDEDADVTVSAWDQFLNGPFEQIVAYDAYVSGIAPFDTHQGVKGLEFPRVMVIMDDQEARGFLFSYDKFFGAKDKSDTDIKNEREGSETTIDRTRRLFYVTCSRAKESLAVVAYSGNPARVRDRVIAEGWFSTDEVEILNS